MENRQTEITPLLERIRGGDKAAHEKLSKLVYGELKKIARAYRRRERRTTRCN